jgi:hypothetical protein
MQRVTTIRLGATLLATILATSSAMAQQCSAAPDKLTSFGYASDDGIKVSPGQITHHNYQDEDLQIKYLRFLVDVTAPPGAAWSLTIRDRDLRPIETLSSATFGASGRQWTRRIYTHGEVRLDMQTVDPTVKITLPTVIVMPEKASQPYYSIQGDKETFKDLYIDTPTESRAAGDHVGMISAIWGKASWCCSAVAVAEDLVLTNWHCGGNPQQLGSAADVWSQAICDRTMVDFSWDGDAVDREFACKEVVDKNEAADFALLRVQPVNRLDTLRPAVLRRQGPALDEILRMIHHPACRSKQLTTNCKVASVGVLGWKGGLHSDFKYPCDSENGSSGAPLFDAQNRVVGIHHLGFEVIGGTCDRQNKGVALSSVLNAMKPAVSERVRQANPPR